MLGHLGPLGEKPHIFVSLGLLKFLDFQGCLFILKLSYSKPFCSTLNYGSTANIKEVMKFYNLSDKPFETVLGQKPPGQKPPGHKPPDKNPLDKNPPCQKPPRQNILFRNFITFVFRMSYGKEISIWFLAVKYVRHGSIK